MAGRTVGERELALLREIVEDGPGSVGEIQSRFGAPRGLARSTVLTMMERLRAKGYLTRRRERGVYRYFPKNGDVLASAVSRFVDTALGGSLSPFVAYLSGRDAIDDDELADLERLVLRLKSKRRER